MCRTEHKGCMAGFFGMSSCKMRLPKIKRALTAVPQMPSPLEGRRLGRGVKLSCVVIATFHPHPSPLPQGRGSSGNALNKSAGKIFTLLLLFLSRTMRNQKLLACLFPDVDRTMPGLRWINIILRTIHLIGVAGVGGGFLYQSPLEQWMPYLGLTVASGIMLTCLAIWTNGMWLIQLRGVAMLVKLLLLGLSMMVGAQASVIIAVIIISGIIAHAPGKVRYHKVFRGPAF
jgi:hypothetical protein